MSWVAVGITLAVVSGATSMYAQYQQGKAQEAMYQAQADQARQDAIFREQQAQEQSELAQDQGKEQNKKLHRQQVKFLAKQKANLAAMGISGVTAEDIIQDTLNVQDIDKATLRWNADQSSWEAITTGTYQKWALNNQANMADAAKANTRSATRLGMTSTFLSTASSIAGMGAISSGGGASAVKAPTGSGYKISGSMGKSGNLYNKTFLTPTF